MVAWESRGTRAVIHAARHSCHPATPSDAKIRALDHFQDGRVPISDFLELFIELVGIDDLVTDHEGYQVLLEISLLWHKITKDLVLVLFYNRLHFHD